jgi:hypothetical protein
MRNYRRTLYIVASVSLILLIACAPKPSAPPVSPPEPTPSTPPPTRQLPNASGPDTFGTIPPVQDGLWANVVHLEITIDGQLRIANQVSVLRFKSLAERHTVTRLEITQPGVVTKALEAASLKNETWQPSEPELQALTAASRARKAELPAAFRFIGADAFTDVDRKDPITEGALFILNAGGKGSGAAVAGDSFVVKQLQPDHMSGAYTAGLVAQSAGLPIVLGFHGTFDMYHLGN